LSKIRSFYKPEQIWIGKALSQREYLVIALIRVFRIRIIESVCVWR